MIKQLAANTGDGGVESVFGKINPPDAVSAIGSGAQGINNVLNTFVSIIFVVAAIIVLFMFLFGALQWITSGGEKEAISKARGRITAALIGLVLLALTFVILRVLSQVLGFELFFGALEMDR